MRHLSPSLVLWACLLTLLGVGAQAKTPVPIHFTASVSPSTAHSGEVVTVTVHAAVDPGWHVYSVVPTPDGPAATEIKSIGTERATVTPTQGAKDRLLADWLKANKSQPEAKETVPGAPPASKVHDTNVIDIALEDDWQTVGPTTEDAPIRKLDPNFGKEVGFHEDQATFTRQFRVPATAQATLNTSLTTIVHYQTCNDKICLPPTDVTVPASITVTPGPVRPEYANAAAVMPSSPAPPVSGGGGASLPLFLLAALGGGLLAILTPCVFPLIPITLTNFVKQSGGDKSRLVRLSVGYALGIVALYVALGATVAALLRGQANTIAANPWVNLVEFVLFVVFALSFFETIQLRLPANLGGLQQSARRHGGTAGLALLGVSFVLGSFTCTAPFVGTLLVSAANGQWLRPIVGMLVFALAFASPFFVFAAFPQWIGRIPKSGLWLARFKATLGFVELAAALKFLSNADQVWQWKLLTEPVLLAAWAVIFLLAALYLFGPLRFGVVAETEPAGAQAPLARRLVASVFAFAALYCFWGLTGRPISPYVGAFLPPPGYGGVAAKSEGLPWLSDYDAALAQARAENRLLLIDFTGYTCTNCRLNEKNVFPHPPIQAEFANYVRVQLYTDGGADGPKNQKLQQDKFGDVALPLYGVVNPQTGAVVDKTEGVQTVGGFQRFLAQTYAMASPSLGAGGATEKASLWAPYTSAAAAQAAQQGKPAIIDFTAKWCVNCKQIEHDVFEHPDVKPALGRDFVTLRADLTQWGSPPSLALQKQYGFAALPTIVFLDKTGHELKPLRITGRLPVADFQKRMQAAGTAIASR